MIPMLGLMVDTSIAMLRLILGGVLERYPQLQIVHPHAGGVLPYLMGRIVEQTEVKRRGREHITQSPAEYYKRVYLDLVTPSALAIRYAYDFAGADRLLFGSDHPWVGTDTMLSLIEGLDLPEQDRARILGLNAASLFGIPQ
jgi:predicted TIM-barrel fold metal-dependent hydrolase